MGRFRPAVVSLLFVLLALSPLPAADDLTTRIEAITRGTDYRQARWGILVVDAETGQTVYAAHADQLFTPASTTKLYSCAAALAAYGPDHKFETPVYRQGDLKDGQLHGDLVLVARGDLTLGGRTLADGRMAFKDHDHIYANGGSSSEVTETDPLAGLTALAKQVAAAGIRKVSGEILIDDNLFAKSRGSGSGPDLLSPIVINDNVIDVIITPAKEVGKPARVQLRPNTGFVQMDADVATVAEKGKTAVDVVAVGFQRFMVRGTIALNAKPLVRIYPVDSPAGFARALFIEALRREGVTVAASPLQPPQTEGVLSKQRWVLAPVATYTSPPFSELIKVTLKVSHNLYASTLPLLVAVKNKQRTLEDGLHWQRGFLADLGVETTTISFAGGAGGANADAVTPRATVALLQALAKRPDYPAFHAGLPVLGVDGTLVDVVDADSPARGKVQAKTGTLYWHDAMNERILLRSKALAGTMTTAKGRKLVLAMFVNDVPLPPGVKPEREGKVIGKLCEIIYQHTP